MKHAFATIIFAMCVVGIPVFGMQLLIESIDTPDAIIRYVDEYDTAQSLIQYLTSQQVDTHCKFELLQAAYGQDYGLICVLHNVFDGSWHLLVDIGDEAVVERKTIVVMRDSSVIHHQDRYGSAARDYMVGLIPHIDRQPGEYIVHVSIKSGEESTASWRFHTDDLPIGEG